MILSHLLVIYISPRYDGEYCQALVTVALAAFRNQERLNDRDHSMQRLGPGRVFTSTTLHTYVRIEIYLMSSLIINDISAEPGRVLLHHGSCEILLFHLSLSCFISYHKNCLPGQEPARQVGQGGLPHPPGRPPHPEQVLVMIAIKQMLMCHKTQGGSAQQGLQCGLGFSS